MTLYLLVKILPLICEGSRGIPDGEVAVACDSSLAEVCVDIFQYGPASKLRLT